MSHTPKVGDLHVWWIPQVPGKPFEVNVDSLLEGKKLLETLANYDLFQFENNIKPDYCNAGGLAILEEDGWYDWESADGDSIDEIGIDTIRACNIHDELVAVLGRIISDLPSNRDWLDPVLEARAKDVLAKAKGGPTA